MLKLTCLCFAYIISILCVIIKNDFTKLLYYLVTSKMMFNVLKLSESLDIFLLSVMHTATTEMKIQDICGKIRRCNHELFPWGFL